ncbi:MAG: CvpA family protein [Oscillospiraceae bacterium]|nr:CvpA family protein [Oscillospiraceae bacterium]
MDAYLPILYDLLALLVLILMIRQGARRGFARTVVSFLGFFIAAALAGAFAQAAAPALFERFIRPGLVERAAACAQEFWQGGQWRELAEGFLKELAPAVTNALSFGGLDLSVVEGLAAETGAQAARELVDQVFAKPCVMLISSILFLLAFGELLFVVRQLAKALKEVNRIPLIGPVNALLGGVVGALEGALTVYLAVLALSLLMALTGDALPFISRKTVEGTWLLRYFFVYDPFGASML